MERLYPEQPDNIDLIVMVDTSQSMFPYFEDVINYLIRDILYEKLRYGDTFHLLSFASKPEVEIAEKITKEVNIRDILKRISLLQPLGKYTDLVSAIKFLYQYVEELPISTSKTIILLTDGIHDPPPWSPYFNVSRKQILDELSRISRVIKREGWSIHLVQMPQLAATEKENISSQTGTGTGTLSGREAKTGTAARKGEISTTQGARNKAEKAETEKVEKTENQSLLKELSSMLKAPLVQYNSGNKSSISNEVSGFPYITWKKDLGKVGKRFLLPIMITNPSDKPILFKLSGIILSGKNILERTVSLPLKKGESKTVKARIRLPDNIRIGRQKIVVSFVYQGKERITPERGQLSFYYTGKTGFRLDSFVLLRILYVLLALLSIFILIFLFFFLKNRVIGISFEKYMHLKPTESSKPIEMRVEFQNPYIGFRNIHRIPQNHSRTVGGGNSDYLIFLLPVPPRIAIVENRGGKLIFKPLKEKFFPDTKGQIEDCLNRKINFVSQKGHKSSLYFREYVSPLEEINRLMRSVNTSTDPEKKTESEREV